MRFGNKIRLKVSQKYLHFWLKSEIRISKSETNSNDQILKFKTFLFWSLRFWTFALVSDLFPVVTPIPIVSGRVPGFVLRTSDLKITPVQMSETSSKIG
ncbi:MAG: hypothetical protein A2Y79_00400 [Deltaproteobacteria bacterium RBG_13_43_22]|nr:MAG: hypothetical protein A2Y79_00400 [Deltaproteobacteria bacterium RBG_13_43_22]